LDQLIEKGICLDEIELRRFENGKLLHSRPAGKVFLSEYQAPWMSVLSNPPKNALLLIIIRVIHRADYQQILWDAAELNGVDLRLGVEVVGIDFDTCTLKIRDGDDLQADVIVGADGMTISIQRLVF
jgi:salicylate hydroxylase